MDGTIDERIKRINEQAAVETAATQKYLADKAAYETLASQLPSIEQDISRQQRLLDTFSGFYSDPKAKQQLSASIKDLEAKKAQIANRPDLSAVEKTIQEATPATAPAQPAANAPAPAPEKPQYDPFAEFRKQEEFRKGYWDFAMKEIDSAPLEIRRDVAKIASDVFGMIAPKPPQNMAVPLIDAMTGKPLEGYALIGGKVEKIEKPKVEEDGRSVIGYEGKAPTVQEASKFREYLAETESGSEALDELINLGKTGSMLNPTDRARAGNLAIMIQGKFRPDIVGPGAVTDRDATVLKDVVRNPLSITLADNIVLLEDFKRRMISGKDKKAKVLGLNPIGQSSQPSQGGGGSGKSYIFDPSRNKVVPK